jgi:hypothetical protein
MRLEHWYIGWHGNAYMMALHCYPNKAGDGKATQALSLSSGGRSPTSLEECWLDYGISDSNLPRSIRQQAHRLWWSPERAYWRFTISV